MRRVMDDSERVHEVVLLDRHDLVQLFGVAEAEVRLEPEDLEALLAQLEALLGKVDHRDVRAGPSEVDGVGADAAADLEHFLAAPELELSELRDVGLDEILASLDLIEILARADRVGRVADIAGPSVPVGANLVDDRGGVDARGHFGRQARARAASVHIPASAPARSWLSSPSPRPM